MGTNLVVNFRKALGGGEKLWAWQRSKKSYRKSEQYINMINLYPILQTTLIDCEDESLVD